MNSGQLEPDVRVGDWSMPWNARDGVGRLGPGIPKSDFWASAKEGIEQFGCVYTAQGFEFDYVGVIFGPDLVYRPIGWGMGRPARPVARPRRVLLTRGLRGCYVYFMDAPTRDFFLSRVDRTARLVTRAAENAAMYRPGSTNTGTPAVPMDRGG